MAKKRHLLSVGRMGQKREKLREIRGKINRACAEEAGESGARGSAGGGGGGGGGGIGGKHLTSHAPKPGELNLPINHGSTQGKRAGKPWGLFELRIVDDILDGSS